jgi:dGTP triphosphohydrolase
MGERRKNALNELINSVCDASLESIRACETNPEAFIKIEYPPSVQAVVADVQGFFTDYIFKKDDIRRQNEEGQYYIRKLFEHWMRYPPEGVQALPINIAKFIAKKTDQEIIREYQRLFAPYFI